MNKLIDKLGDRIYIVACFSAILIWSTSIVVIKIAYTTFPPITLAFTRSIIATFALALILMVRHEFKMPESGDLRQIFLSGALGITAYFTLQNLGINLTTATNAALIVASYPAITTLLELIIYKVKPSKKKVFGLLLAVVGVYILSYVSGEHADNRELIGIILLLGAGFAWAFYNFVTIKVISKYPAVTFCFYQTLAGSVLLIPLTLTEYNSWQAPTALSFSMALYLSLFCSVAAFLCYNFGLRKLSPSASVSMTNLMPIFGVFFSAVILGESLSLQQITGGFIVIAGVMISLRN